MLSGVPADLPVTTRVSIPGDELTERFSRSSGPGGQGVNTTDSRVELVWGLSSSALPADLLDRLRRRLGSRLSGDELVVVAGERRSQLRNREAARERLAGLVRAALAPPPPPRRPTRPSRGATERRLDSKRRRAETKRRRRTRPDD
jgi:ribosome-associated protein